MVGGTYKMPHGYFHLQKTPEEFTIVFKCTELNCVYYNCLTHTLISPDNFKKLLTSIPNHFCCAYILQKGVKEF